MISNRLKARRENMVKVVGHPSLFYAKEKKEVYLSSLIQHVLLFTWYLKSDTGPSSAMDSG